MMETIIQPNLKKVAVEQVHQATMYWKCTPRRGRGSLSGNLENESKLAVEAVTQACAVVLARQAVMTSLPFKPTDIVRECLPQGFPIYESERNTLTDTRLKNSTLEWVYDGGRYNRACHVDWDHHGDDVNSIVWLRLGASSIVTDTSSRLAVPDGSLRDGLKAWAAQRLLALDEYRQDILRLSDAFQMLRTRQAVERFMPIVAAGIKEVSDLPSRKTLRHLDEGARQAAMAVMDHLTAAGTLDRMAQSLMMGEIDDVTSGVGYYEPGLLW
jgi:hypothetical protein